MLRPKADGGCLLGAEVGTGKTLISLEFCRRYNAQVILAVVPKNTIPQWAETAERLGLALPVRQISSTKAGMAAMSDLKWVRRGLYLITHQLFEAWSWREEPVIDRKPKKQTTLGTFRWTS